MQPSAYLVNTSRGEVVDEQALAELLASRHIAGAGLDVYAEEPAITPALLDLPNVCCCPILAQRQLKVVWKWATR